MSRSFSTAALGAILLLAANTSAAVANPTKASAKHAVVDIQAVILNVSEGKEARATLEKEIKAKEAELQKDKESLDKMNQDWKSQAAVLSESARMQKQQEFQEKFLALRNQEMNFQAEIKRKEQKATQSIAANIQQMVADMAKSRGYEAVFEVNSSGLLYLKDPADLTKEIIDAYEAKFTKGAPTAKK